MTEAQHQVMVMKWSRQPHIREKWPELAGMHHVPNGGSRNPVEGRHLKEQGVKPGVPDLDLPVARGGYHGLRIEMKTERGKTTPEQDWWIAWLLQQGYMAEVCHGYESAILVIEWYMGLEA